MWGSSLQKKLKQESFKNPFKDFLGGLVDKNPLANAGDMGFIPGPGRFRMPLSKALVLQLLSPRSKAGVLVFELVSPRSWAAESSLEPQAKMSERRCWVQLQLPKPTRLGAWAPPQEKPYDKSMHCKLKNK